MAIMMDSRGNISLSDDKSEAKRIANLRAIADAKAKKDGGDMDWVPWATGASGFLLAHTIASSLLEKSEEEKRKSSKMGNMISSILPYLIGAAGAYGGYALGDSIIKKGQAGGADLPNPDQADKRINITGDVRRAMELESDWPVWWGRILQTVGGAGSAYGGKHIFQAADPLGKTTKAWNKYVQDRGEYDALATNHKNAYNRQISSIKRDNAPYEAMIAADSEILNGSGTLTPAYKKEVEQRIIDNKAKIKDIPEMNEMVKQPPARVLSRREHLKRGVKSVGFGLPFLLAGAYITGKNQEQNARFAKLKNRVRKAGISDEMMQEEVGRVKGPSLIDRGLRYLGITDD